MEILYTYTDKTYTTKFTDPDNKIKEREISMPVTTSTPGDGTWFDWSSSATQIQASHI